MLDQIRYDEVGVGEFLGVIAALATGLHEVLIAKDLSFVSGFIEIFFALKFHIKKRSASDSFYGPGSL